MQKQTSNSNTNLQNIPLVKTGENWEEQRNPTKIGRLIVETSNLGEGGGATRINDWQRGGWSGKNFEERGD